MVGSEAKPQLIRETYGIPDSHIFNSRDISFAKGFQRMTTGVASMWFSTHRPARCCGRRGIAWKTC